MRSFTGPTQHSHHSLSLSPLPRISFSLSLSPCLSKAVHARASEHTCSMPNNGRATARMKKELCKHRQQYRLLFFPTLVRRLIGDFYFFTNDEMKVNDPLDRRCVCVVGLRLSAYETHLTSGGNHDTSDEKRRERKEGV